MAQIVNLSSPESMLASSYGSATLDEHLVAAMGYAVETNQQLRNSAETSMNLSSPQEMMRALAVLGDHKIHTETLLAYAREMNKGIETLIKA